MNKYLTIILLLISHCAISQEMKCHIITTNYPVGSRLSRSVISDEKELETNICSLFKSTQTY